jgi:hypothetical protein
MDDVCIYQIHIRGQVIEDDLIFNSPLQVNIEKIESASTWISIRADQAGMIALIRHLHGLGLKLLSIQCLA